MADIADRLLSDMSKVKNSSKGRTSAKSRAKQENRQQAQVLTNFANAMGNKALSVFANKMRSIEKSIGNAKSYNQRVTIKTSYNIETNPTKAKKLLKAHVSYVTRDSAGDSQPFSDHGIDFTKNDIKEFAEGTTAENEKLFRFIISPEKAKDFTNDGEFKKFIADCMIQLSNDLPGKPVLNWTAKIHYDTDNPHCHVLLKGLSKTGQDITIPKEYIKTTFRERAECIATNYLGTRSIKDIQDAKLSEITASRLTSLDHDILRISIDNTFNLKTFDKSTKSLEYRLTNYIIPRLDYMCKIGLATKEKSKYTLHVDYKKTLQEMPLNNDIIKKLAALKKSHYISSIAKYDPFAENKPITGTVIDKNFYNEEKELSYIIVLDSDKKSHYVKLNKNSEIEGNGVAIGNTVEVSTKSFTGKDGQEYRQPSITLLYRLSQQDQIKHIGITELDKLIASNDYHNENPNIYQKQTLDAIQARIDELMSEKKLFLIKGKYLFAKTYWLDAEKAEHSSIQSSFTYLTYYRLSEKETFKGRIVATKLYGNENHAIISNGKEFITIPIRGRLNKYNDKTTFIQVTMNKERKGYSAPLYSVTPIMQQQQEQTQKI